MPNSAVAIFDLDLTLLDGDCELMYCDFMLRHNMVDEAFIQIIGQYWSDYKNDHLDYPAYEKFTIQPLTTLSGDQIDAFLVEYLAEIEKHFRAGMLKRLEMHHQQGYELLLATASNSILARPIAKMLRIPNLICTQMELVNGTPTGALVEEATFRDGKARKVLAWVKDKGLNLAGSWGYSDSYNDLPILKMVEFPVAVTPDALLRAHANQNGWPIIESTSV